MTLLLDTTTIAQGDRAEALREAMSTAGVPANVTPLQTPDVEAKLNHWQIDDAGTTLMHREGTGVWLSRTARQVRIADPDRIGLTLLSADRWTFQQFRSDHAAAGIPSLVLVHQGSEYDHRRWDYGTTIAINMERSVLDVPVETVIRASQNLGPDCPLHKLACDYLRNLVRTARDSPDALAHLAATTTNLVRAVICAAAGDSHERDALAASLVERIRLYIDARITDPELSPALIAAAHHISVRHLYNVWGSADVGGRSLSNWILASRLQLAKDRLATPALSRLTVATIGRSCGFTDPTHFGRRFRAAYGITPREWRGAQTDQNCAVTADSQIVVRP